MNGRELPAPCRSMRFIFPRTSRFPLAGSQYTRSPDRLGGVGDESRGLVRGGSRSRAQCRGPRVGCSRQLFRPSDAGVGALRTRVRRATTPGLGWVAIEIIHSDSLFNAVPNPWHEVATHLDEVVAPPDPWRVLAANDSCSVQAMRAGIARCGGCSHVPRHLPMKPRSR